MSGRTQQRHETVTGSVTKHGNPRLRAALVECAWRMVRFQPQYPPVKKRLSVLAKGARATGAQRKKAIVAVPDTWPSISGVSTPDATLPTTRPNLLILTNQFNSLERGVCRNLTWFDYPLGLAPSL